MATACPARVTNGRIGSHAWVAWPVFLPVPRCRGMARVLGSTGSPVGDGFVVVAIMAASSGVHPRRRCIPWAAHSQGPAGRHNDHHHKAVAPKAKPRKRFAGAWPLAWTGSTRRLRKVRTCFTYACPSKTLAGLRPSFTSVPAATPTRRTLQQLLMRVNPRLRQEFPDGKRRATVSHASPRPAAARRQQCDRPPSARCARPGR